jgi:hypothetical protein
VDTNAAYAKGKPNTSAASSKVTGSAKLQGAQATIQTQAKSMGDVADAGKRELNNLIAGTKEDIKNSTVGVADLPSPLPKMPQLPDEPHTPAM